MNETLIFFKIVSLTFNSIELSICTVSTLTLEMNFQIKNKKKLHRAEGLVSMNGDTLAQSCASPEISYLKVLRLVCFGFMAYQPL